MVAPPSLARTMEVRDRASFWMGPMFVLFYVRVSSEFRNSVLLSRCVPTVASVFVVQTSSSGLSAEDSKWCSTVYVEEYEYLCRN